MLAITYVVILCALTPLPLQDHPAHLLNAIALSDLVFHGGKRFGGMFSYHFLFVPYVLGDLGYAVSIEIFGPRAGSALWLSFIFLSLPLALAFFMRVACIAVDRRALVLIVSLYLASDWFFMMGFLSYRLGLALIVATLALLIRLRKEWSTLGYLCYGVLVALGYLVHLTTIAMLTPAAAVSGMFRLRRGTTSIRTEAVLAAPLIALWAWHFWAVHRYTRSDDPIENPYVWGTLPGKLMGLDYEFVRYNMRWDLRMMAVLVVCLILSVAGIRLKDLRVSPVIEMLLLTATFLGVYLFLPRGYSEAWYVDVRALALISVCAVLAFASVPAGRKWPRVPTSALAATLAIGLATTNLIYIQRSLASGEVRLTQYRAIVAAIPPGARVLPVMTRRREGNVSPCRHADAFIAIDRGAWMPYAFNADTANPEKYLRYVSRRYAPTGNWYLERKWTSVDWTRVARDYDYVLVEKPFDPRRILVRRQLVAENGSAALFRTRTEAEPSSGLEARQDGYAHVQIPSPRTSH